MSFDVLAPHYRWMEFVLAGDKLQRCRTKFLDEIPEPQNILLAGEGHGRCIVECRRKFPNARITCLDASAQMLVQSRRRLKNPGLGERHCEWIHADILQWEPTEAYNLIITNFFLDCFNAEQLERVVSKLSMGATPDANWLISDFQTPPAGMKRIRAQLMLWVMYAFFRAITHLPATRLVPPDPSLRRGGFGLHRQVESEWGLLYSQWWKKLEAVTELASLPRLPSREAVVC